jgi:V-type H+-transporting ATPase subunit a
LTPSAENDILQQKIEKILQSNHFENLDIPYNSRKDEIIMEAEQEVNDNRDVLSRTNKEIVDILEALEIDNEIDYLKFLSVCKLVVSREMNFCQKLIYLEKQENLYSLMVWVPEKYYAYLSNELENLKSDDESFTKPKLIKHDVKDIHLLATTKVPTYFDKSVFTSPFQEIVDTYGVPRYQEANPALFTIISFPFFFGLMYGDVGHGSFILLAGILLLNLKDTTSVLYRVKWLIFFMGIFAVFCGLVYSEFFATPLPLFSSCYDINSPTFSKREPDCVYPFGLDYAWYLSSNETSFLNSFKMKFSIIIGVIQMLFGTLLKASNALYFAKWEDFVFEAIPQFLFMLVTFGYMSFCIIYKWLINWSGRDPPSIIQLFINFTSVEEPLYGDGSLQQSLQTSFVYICLISLFLMILPKPIIVYMRQKKESRRGSPLSNNEDDIESKNALFSKQNNFQKKTTVMPQMIFQ